MKITTKIRYGIHTMLEIAMANQEKGILQREIAHKQNISEKYLDQIISTLKTAGLIKNINTKRGYILSKKDSNITMHEIIYALSTNKELISKKINRDGVNSHLASDIMWKGLNNVIVTYLNNFSLRKLKEEQILLNEKKSSTYMYNI